MSEQIIANALGLRPLEEVKKQIIDVDAVVMPDDESGTEVVAYEEKYPDVPEPDKEVLEDIDYAKKNIKDIIEKGKDCLDELIRSALQ